MLKLLAARLYARLLEYDIAFRLQAIDDRILADMGIERSNIPALAHQAAKPDPAADRPVASASSAPSLQPGHDERGLAA